VRGVALYLPILLVVALAVHRRPDRRRTAAALLATAWNVPALLAVNLLAPRAGWWTFDASAATVAGVPADLWIGWALLWGAVPLLATTERLVLAAIALVAADLALMPLGQPVVMLQGDGGWLAGEALAVATCLVPGLLLGRWTARDRRLEWRTVLQVAAFSGLLLFVLPSLAFAVTGEGWDALLARPRWQFVLAALALAPAGAMAVQAVREFVAHGGTPVPLDPPRRLVTSGPYAYVANPMQLGATIVLGGWGVLLASPTIVAGAVVAAAFSAGLASWSEGIELAGRFGDDWHAYRRQVRVWLPRWRPAVFARTCDPCDEVGRFLLRRPRVGLDVEAAETCGGEPLGRITYVRDGAHREAGVAAVARSLEHVNLAWALAGWIARLPVVRPILQLVTDAAGGGPRTLADSGGAHVAGGIATGGPGAAPGGGGGGRTGPRMDSPT
jgi:protein-S-isoprenylcysteine O-methyltransferase Ste14